MDAGAAMDPTPPPARRRVILLLAGCLLLAPLLPTATATADPLNLLGVGANDLRDEPNHAQDANGIPHTGFSPQSSTLVLDAYHTPAASPDVNNLLNRLMHGGDYDAYEAVIFPGLTTFRAWWGWWHDTGSGGSLQEQGLSGSPNGAIDDAHDADAITWDEFVWRGLNPWASIHGEDTYEDALLLFLQPGTHAPVHEQVIRGAVLSHRADDGTVPDQAFEDRTDRRPELGVREGQGWVASGAIPFLTTDASLLATTTSTVSVNPTHLGGDAYDPLEAERVDVDAYTSLHPAVESLYRTAVWDPGDEVDGPGDDAVHPEGAKALAKDTWAAYGVTTEDDATELAAAHMAPVAPFAPLQDAVRPPWTHEPNHPDDDYDVDDDGRPEATHDPATTYGGNPYYDAGPDQGYPEYLEDGVPWLDAQARFGVPAYLGAGHAVFAWNHRPAPLTPEAAGAYPGALTIYAHGGVWWDANGDTFVGDLNEHGRFTSSPHPYARGFVEDPNDYTDHAPATRADPQKMAPWEWRGLCHGSADLDVVVEPTGDTDGDGEGNWGTAGAYVVHDSEGGSNPYDDAVEDTTGSFWFETPAGANVYVNDTDDTQGGGHLSRYVAEGPVTLPMTCDPGDPEGAWTSTAHILLPTGTLEHGLEVRSTLTIVDDVRSPVDGDDLRGDSIRDVDAVAAWTDDG